MSPCSSKIIAEALQIESREHFYGSKYGSCLCDRSNSLSTLGQGAPNTSTQIGDLPCKPRIFPNRKIQSTIRSATVSKSKCKVESDSTRQYLWPIEWQEATPTTADSVLRFSYQFFRQCTVELYMANVKVSTLSTFAQNSRIRNTH